MTSLFKYIHNGQEFFVTNFIINLSRKKKKVDRMEIIIFFLICESTTLDAKLKAFISKINGLERFT